MATFLPSSGAISINDINTVFGLGNNLNAYRGTTYYTASAGPFTFSSGALSMNAFYGTGPVANATYITATGGTVTTSGNYKIHTFTGSGTLTVTQVGTINNGLGYLIVAGGGGGGTGSGGLSSGGGGGAGGLLTGTAAASITSYSITIGSGGSGSSSDATRGANGSNSSAFSQTSIGGGGGNSAATGVLGLTGGSGGGGSPFSGSGPGAGTAGQGYSGGYGYVTKGAADSGGGGGGGPTQTNVTDRPGAAGGSGIVIIRYANTYDDPASYSGATFTNTGGYKILKFTGSGSVTW